MKPTTSSPNDPWGVVIGLAVIAVGAIALLSLAVFSLRCAWEAGA